MIFKLVGLGLGVCALVKLSHEMIRFNPSLIPFSLVLQSLVFLVVITGLIVSLTAQEKLAERGIDPAPIQLFSISALVVFIFGTIIAWIN